MPLNFLEKPLADIHPDLRGKVRGNRYAGAPLFGLISAGVIAQVLQALFTGGAPGALLWFLGAVGVIFAWAAL
jgi:hypothetical protein